MPLGPCLHIFWSFGLLILPSCLSKASSSGDCLTVSQGLFISFCAVLVGMATVLGSSARGTSFPFSLFAAPE